jgi:hypothetical protein
MDASGFAVRSLSFGLFARWLPRLRGRSVAVPGDLEAIVRTFLAEHPAATRDAALSHRLALRRPSAPEQPRAPAVRRV